MKKSIVRVLAGLGVLGLFILIGCGPKRDLTKLEGFAKDPSAGTIFISEKQARHMKHAFDRWFRNPKMYMANGTLKPVGPNQPNGDDDGDVPLGDTCYDGTNKWVSDDSLSRAVWISKDVINYLDQLLQDSTECDGVRIYFAADDVMAQDPYQHFQHQATLYMVPTIENDGGDDQHKHKDVFSYIQSNFAADSLENQGRQPGFTIGKYGAFVIDGNALNHGELCPDQCNGLGGDSLSSKKHH